MRGFNLLILVIGIFSIHYCLYHIFKKFVFEIQLFSCFQLISVLKFEKLYGLEKLVKRKFFKKKIQLFSTLIFCGAAAICITWYLNRRKYDLVLLLDCINFFVCITAVKVSNVRCLRVILFIFINL